MKFAVLVEPDNGCFTAKLIGAPDVCATGPSRVVAIDALREEISQRVQCRELITLDVAPVSVTSLFGTFADDPTLLDISEEAYRGRDSEVEA